MMSIIEFWTSFNIGDKQHTATEQALIDERSTNPASPGIDAMSTPFAIRAAVTLKSAGSKSLANACTDTAQSATASLNFIVGGG
jgi:hypothetical protein